MQIKPFLIAVVVLGWSGASVAQSVAPPTSTKTECAPTQAKPNDPNGVDTTGNKPLTEKLAESGGVLCPPPAVDSEIRVPAPSTDSNMPVIRPPAAQGDAPATQSK